MNDETPSMQPPSQSAVPAQPIQTIGAPVVRHQRHFLAVFFFSFMWGVFGADRFYLGKIGTGILKLVTIGGFGLWILTDLSMVMSGGMRDKQGNEMLEYEKYKKFAKNTVLVSTVAVGIVLLLVVAILFFTVYPLVMQVINDGGIQNIIPGDLQIPGLDQLIPTQTL